MIIQLEVIWDGDGGKLTAKPSKKEETVEM